MFLCGEEGKPKMARATCLPNLTIIFHFSAFQHPKRNYWWKFLHNATFSHNWRTRSDGIRLGGASRKSCPFEYSVTRSVVTRLRMINNHENGFHVLTGTRNVRENVWSGDLIVRSYYGCCTYCRHDCYRDSYAQTHCSSIRNSPGTISMKSIFSLFSPY